jgi:hypothetical protein
MILNENEQRYRNLISEELHVTDERKLNWMAQMANVHAIKEGLQPNNVSADHGGIYATPLNTLGIGNPFMPQGLGMNNPNLGDGIGNTGADFHNPAYVNGSGDVPMSTLSMALEVAAVTVGFDLVATVVATGPMAMLTFVDYPYAGGKLGHIGETWQDGIGPDNENKPIYIMLKGDMETSMKFRDNENVEPGRTTVTITGDTGKFIGIYMGNSRIDGSAIFQVKSVKEDDKDISIAQMFQKEGVFTTDAKDKDGNDIVFGKAGTPGSGTEGEDDYVAPTEGTNVRLIPELVKGITDHIQSFSNFFGNRVENEDGSYSVVPSDDPMTRAQNETGTGNTIGVRMFSKMIQMGNYEVTGAVTRQQLQDMPLYGIDVIGGVLEACQAEISQALNNRIIDRVMKLGVENYKVQKAVQGCDFNLYLGNVVKEDGSANLYKPLNEFKAYNKFRDLNGKTVPSVNIPNATKNSSAENVTTHQRRIASRCMAASNLISSVTRRGRAHWILTNAQILTALQDCSGYVVAPMVNNLVQGGEESLYYAGSIAGMQIYVDPYMLWEDTRICVGRRATVTNNQVQGSGVVFMPYILADTVQIVAEGTMAPKMLVNSRYAIVDAGFYPEQNYYTFMVETDSDFII